MLIVLCGKRINTPVEASKEVKTANALFWVYLQLNLQCEGLTHMSRKFEACLRRGMHIREWSPSSRNNNPSLTIQAGCEFGKPSPLFHPGDSSGSAAYNWGQFDRSKTAVCSSEVIVLRWLCLSEDADDDSRSIVELFEAHDSDLSLQHPCMISSLLVIQF